MPDISALLAPRSIAVVGASPDMSSLRGRMMQVMCAHAYPGEIHPVSRSHAEVMGRKAFKSIADIPGTPDLVVIIIPAANVPDELERCGKAGVKAAVIISSGFAEEGGGDGSVLQARVRDIAKRYDMAVMGPNSEGYANLELSLAVTFSPVMNNTERPLLPEKRSNGRIAVISQSGGMGFAFYDRGRPKELAFSHIITSGNEAVLDSFAYVDHLLDAENVDVILMLLEDIKDGQRFRTVAEKALKAGKPLIVNKLGQSDAGKRAAASHTAALAGDDTVIRAMCDHYGVIEGGDLDQMVDLASAFLACRDKLPSSRRVGIATASGGGGAWLADAAVAAGLEVPTLDGPTRARIDTILPAYGSSQNPVDGTAQAIHKVGYGGLAELVAASPEVDGVLVVASGRAAAHVERERDDLIRVGREAKKPILFWSYTLPAPGTIALLNEAGFPLFTSMGNAARAMAMMATYRERRTTWLARAPSAASTDALRQASVAHLIDDEARQLTEAAAKPILAAYGIARLEGEQLVQTAQAAGAAARAIGRSVAIKVQSPQILHKSDAGAVLLNVPLDEVESAFATVIGRARAAIPNAAIEGVLVQPMAGRGVEMIVGTKRDSTFGPMVMVGCGGVLVELMDDVVIAPAPVGFDEARGMIVRLKGARLLAGYRGGAVADLDALAKLVVAVSELAFEQRNRITEIDLNPVIVHARGEGVSVADAMIIAQAADATKDT